MNGKEKRKNAVAYILFLVVGTITFFTVSFWIQVPLYQTVEAKVAEDPARIEWSGETEKFCEDCPIYVYESREEALEKVEKYQVRDGDIVMEKECSFPAGTKIKVDIQTQEVSLLRLIFLKGGNSQS